MSAIQNDKNVIAVYEQLRTKKLIHNNLNIGYIVELVTQLIPIVQKIVTDTNSGDYKKSIVIEVLRMVVEDSNINNNDKIPINLIIDTTVPFMIDTMIHIAKGEIDLAKNIPGCFSCIGTK